MEEDRERLERLAQATGLTEDEVLIMDYLDQATRLYLDLPDNYDKDMFAWNRNRRGLDHLLMWRIVKREHPEGWVTLGEEEDRELAEEG